VRSEPSGSVTLATSPARLYSIAVTASPAPWRTDSLEDAFY
jgi:hypothetical protein